MVNAAPSSPIANRREPIPILRIPSLEEAFDTDSDRSRTASPNRDSNGKKQGKETGKRDGIRNSIQDRLFAGIMSQIIPSDESATDDVGAKAKKGQQDSKYVERPNFSVGLMSTNFRRFNARIGVVFVLQVHLTHLFTWRHKTATLSFLAIYSLLCLNPHLIPLVPLAGILFYVMIPAFLRRHPISENDPRMVPSLRGPAVVPATLVKPAPEMSKDFFRNMRDLQNCMEDFSRIHDAVNDYIVPATNFSTEALSSSIFLVLIFLCCAAFLASSLIPWRAIALVTGWAITLLGYPGAVDLVLSARNLRQIKTQARRTRNSFQAWVARDILFDEPPERREVEIFELQKFHAGSSTWEPWLFSPTPWDPLSPSRVAGARPRGTQFFEDVQSPAGWAWKGKKWALDLQSREWVEQRMITGVEIEIEHERWVYDLPDELVREMVGSSPKKGGGGKSREIPRSGWEEGVGINARGEWRRRRWIRVVERKVIAAVGS